MTPPAKTHTETGENQTSASWLLSTRLHLICFSFLLVATPFIMLRSYLQDAIGKLSMSAFTGPFGELPIIPTLAATALLALLLVLKKHVERRHIFGILAFFAAIAVAQQIADYYFDHHFYELQQNWHYFAYGIFAWMMQRDLAPRGISTGKILFWTGLMAILFSSFDEGVQFFISSRVFDLSDVAKDYWGAFAGCLALVVGSKNAASIWRSKRHCSDRLKTYLERPKYLLILMFAFGFIFLSVSSLLSDPTYKFLTGGITATLFLAVLTIFHLSKFLLFKRLAWSLIVALFIAQMTSIAINHNKGIMHNRYGLTVYAGVPIPFFDVMIFPNGSFRLVDKKHSFNTRDQQFFWRQEPDILLIGTGSRGLGGQGWKTKEVSHFKFNPNTGRGTQIILLPTPQACETYNRLKMEGKNVLYILHNTC
jgi:VanZ family protein